MTERSLTPSPHRSQNLERGAFSSLSALNLYKQTVEERKQLQSSSTIVARKSPLAKPRSPVRLRPAIKKVEKSPDPQPRSPLKVQNRGREEIECRNDVELAKLQETIKSLKLQLEREKRMHLKLESEIMSLRQSQKSETEKCEKIQKSMQGLLTQNTLLISEKDKLSEDLKKIKDSSEETKEQLKSLSSVLVSILSTFFLNFEEDSSLVGKEKFRVVCKIKDLVSEKLQEIMDLNSIDLTRQLNEVRGWLLARNLPKQIEKITKAKDEIPEISYTVEYFAESSNSLGSTNEYASPSKYNRVDFCEELSFTNQGKTAIALYDFEGERDEDLAFFSGDTIEILEECESGWWIGTLHGKTGSFPYNFVQII